MITISRNNINFITCMVQFHDNISHHHLTTIQLRFLPTFWKELTLIKNKIGDFRRNIYLCASFFTGNHNVLIIYFFWNNKKKFLSYIALHCQLLLLIKLLYIL